MMAGRQRHDCVFSAMGPVYEDEGKTSKRARLGGRMDGRRLGSDDMVFISICFILLRLIGLLEDFFLMYAERQKSWDVAMFVDRYHRDGTLLKEIHMV